jgi:hypothetical protein
MRGLKTLLSSTALLAGVLAVSGAIAPAARAQVTVGVEVPGVAIGIQPVCSYGYYGYAPYGCAPMGYYGSGYFYNGIFLGMGPWANWGYAHGWGGHRFSGDGGGSYHGGAAAYRGGGAAVRSGGGHPTAARASASRPSAAHAAPRAASHASAPHAAAAHSEAPRGGGGGGGDHRK